MFRLFITMWLGIFAGSAYSEELPGKISADEFSDAIDTTAKRHGVETRIAELNRCANSKRFYCHYDLLDNIRLVASSQRRGQFSDNAAIFFRPNTDPGLVLALTELVIEVVEPAMLRETRNSYALMLTTGLVSRKDVEVSSDEVSYASTFVGGFWVSATVREQK
ncbi:MAG: hypothetical protein AAF393_09375 [Pseudomonadota bacterium]